MCILLYDERVTTYRRMQEIDVLLDDHPEMAMELVGLDNRNRQAHKELQLYNDHRMFHYRHPIAANRRQYDDQLTELYTMKRDNPEAFLKEITNTMQNIRRIRSALNTKKYKSDDERIGWEENLQRAEIREAVLKDIIQK